MRLIKELLSLTEAATVPVELSDLIKSFPSKHMDAIHKLWGTSRLVWHGDAFFSEGHAFGPAYEKALEAAKDYINDGYETDCHIAADFSPEFSNKIAERADDYDFMAEFSESLGGDGQECYLGYDPKEDTLYIGFDWGVDEESFNSGWDKYFEMVTGEDFDAEIESHEKVFDKAWKEYQHSGFGFFGLIFKIKNHAGVYKAEEAMSPGLNGFYKNLYRDFKAQHPTVIPLRLD